MVQFKDLKRGSPAFNKNIKLQQDLKLQFKHVDDSLFALSLRNQKLLKTLPKRLGMYITILTKRWLVYPMPKYRKVYRINNTRCNSAHDFLSDILNNMQMSLSSMGSGNLNLVVGRKAAGHH
jgi:hypothetical protein